MIDLSRFIFTFLLYLSSLIAMICVFTIMILPSKRMTNADIEFKLNELNKVTTENVVYGDATTWKFLREKVIEIQGTRCLACGKSEESMHVDHIKPKSRYPHLEYMIDNLQVLCADCNKVKSYVDETDYRRADHLIALLREINNSKLLQRKYVHNYDMLKVLAKNKFKQEV